MSTKFISSVFAVARVALARLRFLAVFAIAALVVGYWDTLQNYWDKYTRPPVAPDALAPHSDIEYYCVMHPTVIRHEPGNCPICGMPLAKRKIGEHAQLPADTLARVQLTPNRIALAGIQTSTISELPLRRDIRAAATLDYDETRVAQLSARVPGRADELFVKSVGTQVKPGDPLYSLYSPELYTAQREYLLARKRVKDLPPTTSDDLRQDAIQVYNASMQKLVLWGTTNDDLARLDQQFDKTATVPTHFVVSSPIAGTVVRKTLFEGGYVQAGDVPYTIADLSNLWLQVRIYEQDVPLIKLGQEVQITPIGYSAPLSTATPGNSGREPRAGSLTGTITFLAYQLDPITRTLAARVELPNPNLQLRPGLFADTLIRIPIAAEHAVTTPATSQPATAPATELATASTQHSSIPTQSSVGGGLSPQSFTADNAAIFRAALDPYFTAHDLLAADKTDGVVLALHEMLTKLAPLGNSGREPGAEPSPDLRTHMEKLTPLVHATMPLSSDLEKLRTAFGNISAEMIALGQLTGTPPNTTPVRVFRCPMDPQPNWLQLPAETINPYQGSKMLTCGNQVSTLPQARPVIATRATSGNAVLAVPRSAVIITGTHKIVFVQNPDLPGAFDMKPVQLAPLATSDQDAEYYPVLSGLNPNDQVVTQGAFLLDAENRLAGTPSPDSPSNPFPLTPNP